MMKMLARLILIKFLTLGMDKPVSFTAAIIPGTTSGRYLGLESSRIHA